MLAVTIMADMSLRPVVFEPLNDGLDARMRSAGAFQTSFEIEGSAARSRFREFFRNFRLGNVYTYRDSLIRHWNRSEFFVEVDLAHVHEYDEVLLQSLQVTFVSLYTLLLILLLSVVSLFHLFSSAKLSLSDYFLPCFVSLFDSFLSAKLCLSPWLVPTNQALPPIR